MVCVETVGELFLIALLYLALAIVNPITVDVGQIGGAVKSVAVEDAKHVSVVCGPF